ncbi:MAG: hypothetical protein SPD90_07315 [Intestinibacter sp.]|uniref:hypothetical protein n=1 Tax=Intestinibacter sp. TaxID=1965304 RepID=UPI002A82DA36|nr:hypothetical protein [Intestinibacter sp.]MDY4574853.1 hypothetical protein [Intestinibacter sp.]
MEFKICGFSPKAASQLGLDGADLLLLEDFVEEKSSNYIEQNDKIYYLLDGQKIEEDLPILNMKKASIYKRFRKMVKIGILEKITMKGHGTYIYCALGPNYYFLVDPNKYEKYTPSNPLDNCAQKSPENKSEEESDSNPNDTDLNPTESTLCPNLTDLNPTEGHLHPNLSDLNPTEGHLHPNLTDLNPTEGYLHPNLPDLFPNLTDSHPNLPDLFPNLADSYPNLTILKFKQIINISNSNTRLYISNINTRLFREIIYIVIHKVTASIEKLSLSVSNSFSQNLHAAIYPRCHGPTMPATTPLKNTTRKNFSWCFNRRFA